MTLTRKWIASPNYSSRGGSKVRLIVLHTAEGARTIEELGNFFAKSSSQVSSHAGADDKNNIIGEYVKRGNKAWTQNNANPVSVSIEMCAFAKWSTSEWNKHPNMLENCAKWIKEEAAYFGIPIVRLKPSQVQSSKGICDHDDLGDWGGTHWDVGDGFPWDKVLNMAKGGKEEEMGYPEWYWDWSRWYLTTDRNPKNRPNNAPEDIPKWAWDANDEIIRIGDKWGMTGGERDWIKWFNGGKEGKRPNVPDDIPDHWWPDQEFVSKQ